MRRQLVALVIRRRLPLAVVAGRRGRTRRAAGLARRRGAASGLEFDALDRSDRCRAPTSTSSPAAAGWRRIRCRPIAGRWGRFDELQERNFTILRRILETRRRATRRADRRRPATTTPRAWTRRRSRAEGLDAARAGSRRHRRAREPGRSAGARRAPAQHRRHRRSSASARRPTCRTRRSRSPTSIRAALGCPIATTT